MERPHRGVDLRAASDAYHGPAAASLGPRLAS